MKGLIIPPLLASAMLAGCAVYPTEPAVGVDVRIG
ncbi:lipoprotein [Burkholderia pseudomallei]|nr:lipoprotein [Burkholderia pseudomallei]CAJ9602089.1 lipoprotein [Burkholderia pseudomallei]CFB49072.1 lipoprotein [Burkholderia pseudomallei]CFD83480.1 lipoprotein [Burkholderia pseudomallei]CFK65651.1 lipoprotein [Burkholderia pseudomallei]